MKDPSTVLKGSNTRITTEIDKVIKEKQLKEKLHRNVENMAELAAKEVINPQMSLLSPCGFVEIDDEYYFVLDYMETCGMKFSSTVLKHESQNPNADFNRKSLADKYGLQCDDERPLYVQLVERRMKLIPKQ